MLQAIYGLGVDTHTQTHTHTHTDTRIHIHMKVISRKRVHAGLQEPVLINFSFKPKWLDFQIQSQICVTYVVVIYIICPHSTCCASCAWVHACTSLAPSNPWAHVDISR